MENCLCISIEGSDGSGKATTTKLLTEYLIKVFMRKVATLSFPRYDKTTGGKLLFEVLKSERKENYDFIALPPEIASLLYVMDRTQSKKEIMQIISENDILIFDRYIASNFIHQGGKINDAKEREELISFLSNLEYGHYRLPIPDITFFLYLPTEIAMVNKAIQREKNGNAKVDAGEDDINYLSNANKAGLWCAEKYNWNLINCIDEKTGKQKTPEVILEEILIALAPFL